MARSAARPRASRAPATPAKTASRSTSPPAEAARIWNEILASRRRIRHQALRPGRAQHAAPGSQDGALRPRNRRLHLAAGSRPGLDRQTRQRRFRRPRGAAASKRKAASRASWWASRCAAAASAATATKCFSTARRRAGSPAARLRPRLNKNIGLVLSARRAGAAGQKHPDHDPQPAGGRGDGGNSVLQTSEMNNVSRKLPIHQGTRMGPRGRRHRHHRDHRSRAAGARRHRLCGPAQARGARRAGQVARLGGIGEGGFRYLRAGQRRSDGDQRRRWPTRPKSSTKIRTARPGW